MNGADEMSTEVMENAANAAAKRREVRRRRILMDPEERMRKLTGYNNSNQGPRETAYHRPVNGVEAEPDMFSQLTTPDLNSQLYDNRFVPTTVPDHHHHLGQESTPYGAQPTFADLFQTQVPPASAGTTQPVKPLSPAAKAAPSQTFARGRHLLYLCLGILVRVSLIYSLGRRFIQSIINPFVFAEVAFIGYQRAIGMDLGANVRGGLWLSTLVLSGIRQDVIDSYKTIMGIVTAILDDFTLYFFAFVVVHLACMPFA